MRLKYISQRVHDMHEPDPRIFFSELSASLIPGAVSSSVSCSAGRLPFEAPSRGGWASRTQWCENVSGAARAARAGNQSHSDVKFEFRAYLGGAGGS